MNIYIYTYLYNYPILQQGIGWTNGEPSPTSKVRLAQGSPRPARGSSRGSHPSERLGSEWDIDDFANRNGIDKTIGYYNC